jgi:recombination protein RecT
MSQIEKLVPQHMTAARLMRIAVNCVAKTPDLGKCTPTSLLQSVLVAAELGLEPGGALGHLYLVPFGTVCTTIVGYRGLIELARRSGEISSIRAVVVREKDKFKFSEGIEQHIEHEPFLDGPAGDLKLAYCVIRLKDGGVVVELMTRAQVEAIRARSRSGKSGPWATDYDEMAKKTVARRALKWAPLSSERYYKAVETDDDDYVDGESTPVEVVAASLKDRVKAKTRLFDVPEEIPEGPVPDPKPTPPKE